MRNTENFKHRTDFVRYTDDNAFPVLGRLDIERKHMLFYHILLYVAELKIPVCVLQCAICMGKAVLAPLNRFDMPIVKEIIVQKRPSDKRFPVYLDVKQQCDNQTNAGNTERMVENIDRTVLNILLFKLHIGRVKYIQTVKKYETFALPVNKLH